MPDPDNITAADWDTLGNRADEIARRAVAAFGIKMVRRHDTGAAMVPIVAGTARAAGSLARSIVPSESLHLIEDMMLAYLRGAIRGLDGPIHEDGRPWEGTFGHG